MPAGWSRHGGRLASLLALMLLLLLLLQQQHCAQAFLPLVPSSSSWSLSAVGRSSVLTQQQGRGGTVTNKAAQLPRFASSSSRRRQRQRQRPSGISSDGLALLAQSNEEAGEEPEATTELGKLLARDPTEKGVLVYLAFVTLGLLGLGTATFKLGGQLMGLGFGDDKFMYWDSAPSYALLLVYPPLFLVFPDARNLLLKTLVFSFVITAAIWAFPYEAIGWEPTNEHVLITAALPILGYLSFFTWRAQKAYLEIVEEEEAEAGKAPRD